MSQFIIRVPHAIDAKLARLPAFQLERILTVPQRGTSHRELFRDSCAMHRCGFTASEQEQVLRARYERYYREITDREYVSAITHAAGASTKQWPRWPNAEPALIAAVLKGEGSVSQLETSSPVQEPWELTPAVILDRYFGENDIMSMGKTKTHTDTETRDWFRGREHEYQFVVPNPMSASCGTTQDGKPSKRCLDNSGPWVSQVIEFDHGTLDDQARLHLKLQVQGAALRMVVYSGGKSLHGWYDVKHWPQDQFDRFRRDAAMLGADRALFTACQFVRVPNALRDNGKIQKTVYLS